MSEKDNGMFALIVAAAGKSSRFSPKGSDDPTVKKTFMNLDGKPIWLRSVEKFIDRKDVIQVIVVVAPENVDWFQNYYKSDIDRLLFHVVAGGENRVDSIRNGLQAVNSNAEYVAVHDAARPCVTDHEINAVFSAAKKYGAALLATPIVGTVKKTLNGKIEKTVPREHLWEAQTPQVFRREWIFEAYQQNIIDIPSDDSQLVERIGMPVHIVPADRGNIKITTPSDLVLAKYLLDQGR